jgi:hypothetical protein
MLAAPVQAPPRTLRRPVMARIDAHRSVAKLHPSAQHSAARVVDAQQQPRVSAIAARPSAPRAAPASRADAKGHPMSLLVPLAGVAADGSARAPRHPMGRARDLEAGRSPSARTQRKALVCRPVSFAGRRDKKNFRRRFEGSAENAARRSAARPCRGRSKPRLVACVRARRCVRSALTRGVGAARASDALQHAGLHAPPPSVTPAAQPRPCCGATAAVTAQRRLASGVQRAQRTRSAWGAVLQPVTT